MKITGKSKKNISKEFIRSWVHATAVVLAYHNYPIDLETLRVEIRDLRKKVNKVDPDAGVGGLAWYAQNRIAISCWMRKENLASTIVHELIHIGCGKFGEHTNEKCTSTLTAKLKKEIHPIAEILIEGTYKRAAYFAHTKIAYCNKGDKDFYDDSQWVKIGVKDKYKVKKKERNNG
jgi:hypothetical protein|tara:strand:- start:31 stop:558 length:528 start_codon:yes stop_codon:yes gene_type:complete